MISPVPAPSSKSKGSGLAFGRLQEQRRANRANEAAAGRRQDFAEEQYSDQRELLKRQQKQKSLMRLQDALRGDDPIELEGALSQARDHGINVSGVENLYSEEARQQPMSDADAKLSGQLDAMGESVVSGIRGEPAMSEADAQLSSQLDTMGESVVSGIRGEPARSPDVSTPDAAGIPPFDPGIYPEIKNPITGEKRGIEPSEVRKMVQEAEQISQQLPMSPPASGLGMDPLSEIAAGGRGRAAVRISDGDQTLMEIPADAVKKWKQNQALSVGSVFQPMIANARDEVERRAADVAQKAAMAAAQGGMSRKQAIELGSERYNHEIGLKYKRDYDKYPPGYGAYGGPGSKGAGKDSGFGFKEYGTIDDNLRGWVTRVQQTHAVPMAQKAAHDAQVSLDALATGEPLAQNYAFTGMVHSLTGSAQTRTEMQRLLGGMDITTRLEDLKRRLVGGEQPQQIRKELKTIMQTIYQAAEKAREGAANDMYYYVKGNPAYGGESEENERIARRAANVTYGGAYFPVGDGKKSGKPPAPKGKASSDDEEALKLLEDE